MYNGLEIVNTYKYQRLKRKARRISKIRCSELSAVYKLKKKKTTERFVLGTIYMSRAHNCVLQVHL